MNVGGPAVQVSGLMRGLPPDLFDQTLITGFCDEDEADYLDTHETGIEAVRLSGLGRTIRPSDDAAVLGKLVSQIRRTRPHIVHTHTAKAGAIGRVATKLSRSRAKTIHTYHGHLLHGYFNAAKTRAVIGAEQLLSHASNRLVTVGYSVRDDLLSVGVGSPAKYRVIPPGIQIGPLPPKQDARRALGIPETGPVLSFIGRVTGIKRPDRFIDVALRVSKHRPDAQFVIVGDGDLMRETRDKVRQSNAPIQFLGMQNEVETCLAASDGVVLTSDNEGTPIGLIEAAMAGIPVVASDVGSVHEVVRDGETGWLAAPDAAALSAAVLELLRGPEEAARRGNGARNLAEQKFGVSRFLNDYEQLYTEVLIEGRGR